MNLAINVLERAERRGIEARAAGTPRTENPYLEFRGIAPASELIEAWWRGWDAYDRG